MHSKSCYLYFIQQQTLKVTLHFNYKSLSLNFIYSGLQKHVYMIIFIYIYKYNMYYYISHGRHN